MKFKGVTLVELMVVVAILGVLIVVSYGVLQPQKQINKVNDGQRRQEIIQIRSALDIFYNDHNCYPLTIPFGSAWTENNTTYMRKVPQDVSCVNNTNCYVYKYSGSCPQWTVLFSKLSKAPDKSACSLSSISGCVPQDYDSTWACTTTGTVDCAYLSSVTLASGSDGAGITPTTAGPTPTSTVPTPTPIQCASRDFSCSGSPATCNSVPAGTGQYCTGSCDSQCAGR